MINFKNLLLLIRIMFKGTIGSILSFSSSTGSKSITTVAVSSIVIFSTVFFVQLIYLFYKIALIAGGVVLLEFSFMLNLIFLLFMSIPTILSNMNQEKDVVMFNSLPFNKLEIAASRLVICLIRIIPFSLFIGVPTILVGLLTHAISLLQIIIFSIIMFSLPLLVIVFIGSLLYIIFKLESAVRFRGIISSILSIFVYISIFAILMSIQIAILPEVFNNKPQMLNQIVTAIATVTNDLFCLLPFNLFAPIFVSNIGALIITIFSSSIFIFLFYLLSQCYSLSYASLDRLQQFNKEYISKKELSSVTINWWLFRRELWIMHETPFFIYQSILAILVPPIALGLTVYSIMTFFTVEGKIMFDAINSFKYLEFILINVAVAMATGNVILPTGISREGKHFYLSKTLPIPYKYHYDAKLLFGVMLSSLSIFLTALVLIFTKMPITHYLGFIITTLAIVIDITIISNIFDLKNPNFNWTHPQQALNATSSSSVYFLLLFIVIGFFSGILFLFAAMKISFLFIYLLVTIIAVIIGCAEYNIMVSKLDKYYEKIWV